MKQRSSSEKLQRIIQNSDYFQKLVNDRKSFRKLHLIKPKEKATLKTSIYRFPKNSININLHHVRSSSKLVRKASKANKIDWRKNLSHIKNNIDFLNRETKFIQEKSEEPSQYLSKLLGSTAPDNVIYKTETTRKDKKAFTSFKTNKSSTFYNLFNVKSQKTLAVKSLMNNVFPGFVKNEPPNLKKSKKKPLLKVKSENNFLKNISKKKKKSYSQRSKKKNIFMKDYYQFKSEYSDLSHLTF
jgi:hypothetical protein